MYIYKFKAKFESGRDYDFTVKTELKSYLSAYNYALTHINKQFDDKEFVTSLAIESCNKLTTFDAIFSPDQLSDITRWTYDGSLMRIVEKFCKKYGDGTSVNVYHIETDDNIDAFFKVPTAILSYVIYFGRLRCSYYPRTNNWIIDIFDDKSDEYKVIVVTDDNDCKLVSGLLISEYNLIIKLMKSGNRYIIYQYYRYMGCLNLYFGCICISIFL
jgi:hypothetical protein